MVRQSVMLRDVTSNAVYGPLLEQALSEIPTISIVTPLNIGFNSPVKASIEMLEHCRKNDTQSVFYQPF